MRKVDEMLSMQPMKREPVFSETIKQEPEEMNEEG
jgi:hypothetical protein